LRRRDLIKVIVGSMTACPLAARAQQPGKLPTIGFLGTTAQSEWPVEAFDKRLRELGWIEGEKFAIAKSTCR
jgi:putative ABC transport system substrate-binding protein